MSIEEPRTAPWHFFLRWIEPDPSIKETDTRRQVQFISATAIILTLLSIVGIVIALIVSIGHPLSPVISCFTFFAITSFVAYLFCRTSNYIVGSILITSGLSILGYWLVARGVPIANALYTTIPLAFILGSILLPMWGVATLVGLDTVFTYGLPFLTSSLNVSSQVILTATGTLFSIGLVLLVTIVFRNSVEQQRLKEIVDANRNLQDLRSTLEQQVKDRTRQRRVASEIIQKITMSLSLDDMLNQSVNLVVEEFGYYSASIFLLDDIGNNATLRAARSPAAKQMLDSAHKQAVGSQTIIGWVTANKEPRIALRTAEDPLKLSNELLPETQAEASLPIMLGDQVLGALDIQSTNASAFDHETITILFALAGQVATAIQNVRTIEATRVNLQGVSDVFRTSYQIAQAQTNEEAYSAAKSVFQRTPNPAILMIAENNKLHITASADPTLEEGIPELPEWLEVSPGEVLKHLGNKIFVGETSKLSALYQAQFHPELIRLIGDEASKLSTVHPELLNVIEKSGFHSVAFIPVTRNEKLATLLAIGTHGQEILTPTSVEPYVGVAELITSALDRIHTEQDIEHRLSELEAITITGQDISIARSLFALYSVLHDHIKKYMGDYSFMVALYDSSTNFVSIPYLYEKGTESGHITEAESLPLGEGLISVLINSKQPLMIVDDVERKMAAIGAKSTGLSAKSWLGTPLIVGGEVIGAIIIQDPEHEFAFDEGDMRFLSTLTTQIAGAIFNARLLDETSKRALQLQTAAEIARDISGSLDLNELLIKAVSLVRDRFNFYHAAIFMVEPNGEYVAVREATGEAGAQMKRIGHKLMVGSKSIVGYVASSGEPMVVNDTASDSTYYANPLLPDTRAELAIPLKVGPRILGALDVQSNQPYSFREEDVNVLRILADQLAIAVINSELFAETQEHLSQHRLLHHVTTAAASGTTIEEAMDSATQGLQVTLGGDRVTILLANKEKRLLQVKSVAGYSEEVKQVVIPYGSGITGWVAVHQQSQRINDVTQDPRYIQVGSNIRSELAIPLIYRGDLLGVLNVESDKVSAFSESDEELLGTLGGSLAAIIANARLVEQVRRQAENERMLREITNKIRRSTDMQTIMATTTSELSKMIGARRASISININDEQSTNTSNPKGA